MRKLWLHSAAFVLMATLGHGASAGASPEEVVDIFKRGCLDTLPNFSGSEQVFQQLGFEQTASNDGGKDFEREDTGQFLFAGVGPIGGEPYRFCLLVAELPPETVITPDIADIIADRTQNRFRHTGDEKGRERQETFSWSIGSLDVLVVLYPDNLGSRRLVAVVTESNE